MPAHLAPEAVDLAVRRTFQALRIAVNRELEVLDAWLRQLPACLRSGGRAAVLTFHSGEDRRVKRAFQQGLREGGYSAVSDGVIRPSPAERRSNPRSSPAKLRWARRA
jgi:16S rRNA (cytosine1402-N4)-methyltransferase